jgi:predicted nuclease with RNAse H fold
MAIDTDAIRTVGVDLSAEPTHTAICTVTWTPDAAMVEPPTRPGYDDAILAACASADRVGIDCPFGWPDSFVAAVSAHAAGQPWPGRNRTSQDYRRELRYRATDYRARDHR